MNLAWNICTVEDGKPRDAIAYVEILTQAKIVQITADKIMISGTVTIEFPSLVILESLGGDAEQDT